MRHSINTSFKRWVESMTPFLLAKKITTNDFRIIGRDRFLQLMFGFVVIIALFLRFALPALNDNLAASGLMPGSFHAEPLSHFYPLLVGFMVVFQGALLSGAIYGFLILDEKEDGTLVAMQVTPVPTANYLGVRMYIPALVAAIVVFVQLHFVGIAVPELLDAIAISIGASLAGPIATLVYANFAQNKLQGFAIAKFVGVAGWIILIGWFIPEPAQWLFGLFPPFLISKAYWASLAGDPNWTWILLLGIVAQLALIALLVRRFRNTLNR